MSSYTKDKPSQRWSRRKSGLAVTLLSAMLLSGCGESPEQMLESAKGYLAKDDLNAASIQLKNALQENANLAEARFLLGKVNLEQGDVPGAVKELQRALDLGYAREPVIPLLARARVRAAEFDGVLADFGAERLSDPVGQASLLGAIGDAHMGKANVAEALKAFEAALALRADDEVAAIGRVRAQLFSGEPAKAEESARKLVADQPLLADAHAALAEVLQFQGKPDESVKALEDALRLRPDAIAYHYALVSQLFQLERQDEAVARFEAMKKVAPGHPSTRYLQAFIDLRANRLTEARDGVMQVLKQTPDYLPAQLLAGTVLLRLNDQAQARSYLNAVLSRAPGQTLARSLLILSHLSSGEAARAQEVLQPLLDRPINDPRLLGLAGQVFLANGDAERAEEFLQRAAKAAPEDSRARLRLGVARLLGGDAQGAFADFSSASAMDQDAIQADLALVAAHLRRGDTDQALAAQAQLEAKQPNNPLVHNLRGGVMLAKQDLAAARTAFDKALAINPDYLAAVLNLARIDLAEKKPQDALARVRALADRNEKNIEARLALAELQAATGATPKDVLATLERAETAAPGALAPALSIVQHHLRNRDFPKALATAQKAGAAYPDDVRAVEMLARAQMANGDTQQAISSLNKLAGLRPQSTVPLLMLADVHRGAKDNAAAEQVLRKALGVRPDALDVQQRLAGLLLEKGDRDGALKIARDVQKQHAEAPVGHILEAEIQVNANRLGEAVTAYRRALERKAGGDVAVRLHATLLRAERKAEADKLVADWLRQQPKDLSMRGYVAERALAERRYADAVAMFRTMDEISPRNPLVLNNLAWASNQVEDPKALSYAELAHELAPENPAILDTLGVIQVDRGQTEKGLANLQKAVSLAPDLLPLRLNLARSYAGAGRKDDARRELDAVLAKAQAGTPLHKEATDLLGNL